MRKGSTMSEESKKKMSESHQNPSEETRRKMSEARKGKEAWNKGKKNCYSEEVKKKISKSLTGKKHSEETKRKMSETKNSEEGKRKNSESHMGQVPWNKDKPCLEKTKIKISNANKGKTPWNKGKTGYKCSDETRRKIRLAKIREIKSKHGQVCPNYNQHACKMIEEHGALHGYTFQHAENGGEYHIKGLGYWVDGYDVEKNVVIEVDEPFHFDSNGELSERDKNRQDEITTFLNCQFIRLKNE